jgi:F-type H+-transporting ATPase subunit delta
MDAAQTTGVKHDTVMDVTEERIARVYAQAFLGATANVPNADSLVEEFASAVNDVLCRFPKLEQTLNSSLISEEQKEQLLGRIFGGKASREVLSFLKVLARHGRLNVVRQASRLVTKLHAERRGMTDIEIRVATPLDDAAREEIKNLVRRALKTEPILHVKVDPSLIAGIVIRVGDRLYDGSVHSQFERTRKKIINLATEQIETRPERFAVA